ncbi:right-handed parallel beta-helix repeat-containing protein, partial [Salmonella enterica subsp. enterica serovar Brijbhumi]|nr:right-handed parallel beta-helix repeat-containing protein [Salmonella enterica subsp. enterica serovar Brijbhumi]
VVATPWKSYYIAGKVYVLASESPSDIEATNFPKRRMQVIDFQGARIVGRDDTSDATNVFIETGYITSTGTISSVFGKSGEEYLTIGTTIRNATLINFYQGFRLRDHVFGCEVTDIVGVNVQQLVYTQRCFYSLFRNLQCNGTYTTGLHRYHFTDECNIQPLISVHTGECDVGFKFEGAVEALTLFNCGIESFRTHGVWIAGAYNIKFDSCYIESNESNVYGVIATSANNITLDNCWIYGSSMKMFGAFDDNTNVRIMPNNRIGGGAVWWDINEGSPYNLSDIHWQTDIKAGGYTLPAVVAKEASTVEQTIVFYE